MCNTSQKTDEDAKALYMEGEEEGAKNKYTIKNKGIGGERRAGDVPRGVSAAPEYIKQVYHCSVQAVGEGTKAVVRSLLLQVQSSCYLAS